MGFIIHRSPGSIAAEEKYFDKLAAENTRAQVMEAYADDEVVHKDGYARGWYFPVSIIRLVIEEHTLTGEDLVLLGIINMMQDPKKQGCWASSEWIARRWGRTARHVQRRLPVLLELGLVRSFQLKDGHRLRRILQVTWAGDNYDGTPMAIRQRSSTTTRTERAKNNGPKQPRNREVRETGGAAGAARCDLVFSDGNFPSTKAGTLCTHFERFIKRHKLHKGVDRRTGKEYDIKINHSTWLQACATLLNVYSPSSIKEVMDWYFEHHGEKYVPKCGSFMSFAEKYRQIKEAAARDGVGSTSEQEERDAQDKADVERQRLVQYY